MIWVITLLNNFKSFSYEIAVHKFIFIALFCLHRVDKMMSILTLVNHVEMLKYSLKFFISFESVNLIYFRKQSQIMRLFPVSLIGWFQSLTKTSNCLMMQSVRPVSWSKVRVWWNWSPKMSPLSVSRGHSPWGSPFMNSSKKWPTYRYF